MPASLMYRSSHGVMLALMVVRVAPKVAAVLCAPGWLTLPVECRSPARYRNSVKVGVPV